MNRRDFLKMTAGGASALSLSSDAVLAGPAPPATTMGVVRYSFSRNPHTQTTLDFLDYCHSLGAGGVQFAMESTAPDVAAKVRARTEELGMYFEAIVSLPKPNDATDFEARVIAAKQAGATCLRTACLSGRRYEDFSSLEQWNHFVAESHQRIATAIPILEKHKLAAGIENHKDWTADELAALLKHYASEYLGSCIDTGNNLSLLDDPMELVEKLAPFAVTTHCKDMAVEEYPDGFLLSEVPMGRGFLDMRHVLEAIAKARPHAHFNLEMITRDPLKIPCLTDKYWATFPERNGIDLARILRLVRSHKPAQPLPAVSALDPAARMKLEEANVSECLVYARDHLGLKAAA